MRKCFIILGLVLFSMTIGKSLYFLKDGFTFRRIHALNNRISQGLNDEANEILKETFTYIGRGRQCFAFASQDGKYVLKFPRTDIYSTPFWARALPLKNYREKLQKNHKERENFILNSFLLSFNELREETGLIALHLGQTAKDSRKLNVIDAFGGTHKLPLYKTSFVLQHKRPLLISTFLKALENDKRDEAEKILDALLDVIVTRAKKGILNRDRSFLRNYGFDGGKAYQIDVGSFFSRPQMPKKALYQKSVRDSTDPIQEWLAKTDPDMLSRLNAKLNKIL